MLRPSRQGLNIPPKFFPHIVLGFWGHVEAPPTLVIIILKGLACGPQHAPCTVAQGGGRAWRTWPAATRQSYSLAPLPKSDPPVRWRRNVGSHAPLPRSRTPVRWRTDVSSHVGVMSAWPLVMKAVPAIVFRFFRRGVQAVRDQRSH